MSDKNSFERITLEHESGHCISSAAPGRRMTAVEGGGGGVVGVGGVGWGGVAGGARHVPNS